MPLNLNPEKVNGIRDLQVAMKAIERHLTDDHYVRGFTPGVFVLGGPGAPVLVTIPVATPRWSAIAMAAAGGNSLGCVTWRKPSQWRIGRVRMAYWYTSPVGSTNTFTIQLSLDAGRQGEVLPCTNLYAGATTVAGPAVANTKVRSVDFYTVVSLGSDDELLSLRVSRQVPDANANEFDLLYVEAEHLPAIQESP